MKWNIKKSNDNINNQTMNQRFVFWKGEKNIFKKTFFWLWPWRRKKEYKKYYDKNQTILLKITNY